VGIAAGICVGLPGECGPAGELSLNEDTPVLAQGFEASKLVITEFAKVARGLVV
jgi:hypothetical protein